MIKNVCAFSETGLKRTVNQDSILSLYNQEAGLFIVADGMGGHFRGELASGLLVDRYAQWWRSVEQCICGMKISEIVAELENLLKEVHKEIGVLYCKYGAQGGTTLCLLLICKNYYVIMNVGDSRIYLCNAWKFRQMTVDDIWEKQDRHYGMLTQAVGMRNEIQPHIYTGKLGRADSLLLCSDGIYKYCEKRKLAWYMKQSHGEKNMGKIVGKFQKSVYQKGAKDNLSLILIDAG